MIKQVTKAFVCVITSTFFNTKKELSIETDRIFAESFWPEHQDARNPFNFFHLCPGKSLRIQTDRDNGRESSPNSSPDNTHHMSHSNPPRHDRRDIDTRRNQNTSCNRVRREQTSSPNRRNLLFGEHTSLFDSIRMTPQQQHPRSTPWAGQQPPKRTCNRIRESGSNRKEEEKDEMMTSHGAPTVPMPRHHLPYPRTYSEYKEHKRMLEMADTEREAEGRRTRSYSEENRTGPTSGHSHNNPA